MESHLSAVKKIIKYVSGTTEFRLWYSQDSSKTVMGYYDVDWAGNSYSKKNLRWVFLSWIQLDFLVSWFSKKHNSISLSIVEAENIAIGSSCLRLI